MATGTIEFGRFRAANNGWHDWSSISTGDDKDAYAAYKTSSGQKLDYWIEIKLKLPDGVNGKINSDSIGISFPFHLSSSSSSGNRTFNLYLYDSIDSMPSGIPDGTTIQPGYLIYKEGITHKAYIGTTALTGSDAKYFYDHPLIELDNFNTNEGYDIDSVQLELNKTYYLNIRTTDGLTIIGDSSVNETNLDNYWRGTFEYEEFTKSSNPEEFIISPDNFDEPKITLNWFGASSSTPITGYQLQYRTGTGASVTNISWMNWASLTNIVSTNGDGTTEINLDENFPAGCYIQYRIRTMCEAGESYYADGYKESNIICRNNSPCTAPTIVKISQNDLNGQSLSIFEKNININWSGATGGSTYTNPITGYSVHYAISNDNSIWGDWQLLKDGISTTTNFIQDTKDTIDRGSYIKYGVQTIGKAGLNSEIKESDTSIRRNSIPESPESVILSKTSFKPGDTIVINWSKSNSIDNDITNYFIEYRITTNGEWGDWKLFTMNTLDSNTTSFSYTFPSSDSIETKFGEYIQFRIFAKDIFDINGDNKESFKLRRIEDPIMYLYNDSENKHKKYIVHLHDGNDFVKRYIPYIYKNDEEKWKHYS